MVADDLVVGELDLAGGSPVTRAGGTESVDQVVEVAQPGDRLDQHVVEHDLLVDRHAAALDVLEDLAALVVEPCSSGMPRRPLSWR